ncbi:MAG: metalloregulator ArsR/SmtB family transcription factor [Candidatus Altiarchaeota archaeon]
MDDRCRHFFSTLGSELKIGIIMALREKPMSVSELSEKIGEERSKVSHGLLLLQRCYFVKSEKEGRSRIYCLNKDTIEPLLSLVERHAKKYCKECNV